VTHVPVATFPVLSKTRTVHRDMALLLAFAASASAATCPSYPSTRFFAHIDSSIVHAFGGGVDIWNASGQLVFDSKISRGFHHARLEGIAQVRELSSGMGYEVKSNSLFLTNGTSFIVQDGVCSRIGAGASSAWSFPGSACAGSIKRFLPPSAMDQWSSATDTFMGFELRAGVNASVWGWNSATEAHRVYLDATTQMPLEETQTQDVGQSYPTYARVAFGQLEAIYGSGELFDRAKLFAPPLACSFELPAWSKSGTSPYDWDAYVCPTKGLTVTKAVQSWADNEAYYNWPTLPLGPPVASVTHVPHEGGPGPRLTCFAGQL